MRAAGSPTYKKTARPEQTLRADSLLSAVPLRSRSCSLSTIKNLAACHTAHGSLTDHARTSKALILFSCPKRPAHISCIRSSIPSERLRARLRTLCF